MSSENENAASCSSDFEEIVEETLIQVVVNNPDDVSHLNVNSNVRVTAIESNNPVLQIENQVLKK